jgi:hypothetical protein
MTPNAATFSGLPLTVIVSLTVAVALLAVRILLMQRVQKKRQRENRQETERLKSMIAAYRALAGSFSPADTSDYDRLEETLSDIVLFGTLPQVERAAACALALKAGEVFDLQPLIEDIRSDLRHQLGLEDIPTHLRLPASGPAGAGSTRGDRDASGNPGQIGNAAGGAAGGAALGLGAGIISEPNANHNRSDTF